MSKPTVQASELVEQAVRTLESLADPEHAKGARRFFKEPVEAYGIRQPRLIPLEREIYVHFKAWPPEVRELVCEGLWRTGKLEAGNVVCHVYRRFHRTFGVREFSIFETWLDRYVNNWAHTDGVSSWLVGGALANEPALIRRVIKWTASPNRWKRRAAAVSVVSEAKAGRQLEALEEVEMRLADDSDPMVRKGLYWLLKELRRKHRLQEAVLKPRADKG